MKTKIGQRRHFLLLPFPAYGHMIPLSELGKRIAQHHHVTFAVSECLFEQIQQRELISPADFNLVCIPDGVVEQMDADNVGKPEKFEEMMSKVYPAVKKLIQALPISSKSGGEPEGDSLGITTPVDVVIGDNMLAGPLAACFDRKIPYHFFNTAAASLTLGALHVDENYPELPADHETNVFMEIPQPDSPPPPMPVAFKTLMRNIANTIPLVSSKQKSLQNDSFFSFNSNKKFDIVGMIYFFFLLFRLSEKAFQKLTKRRIISLFKFQTYDIH